VSVAALHSSASHFVCRKLCCHLPQHPNAASERSRVSPIRSSSSKSAFAHDLRLVRDTRIRTKQVNTGSNIAYGLTLDPRQFPAVRPRSTPRMSTEASQACPLARSTGSTPLSCCDVVQHGLSSVQDLTHHTSEAVDRCKYTSQANGRVDVRTVAHSILASNVSVASPFITNLVLLSRVDAVSSPGTLTRAVSLPPGPLPSASSVPSADIAVEDLSGPAMSTRTTPVLLPVLSRVLPAIV
jgi:hypothetical protein